MTYSTIKPEPKTYTAIGLRDDASPVKPQYNKHQEWTSTGLYAPVQAPITPPPDCVELNSQSRGLPLHHLTDGLLPASSRRSSEGSRRSSSASSTTTSKGQFSVGKSLGTRKLVEVASKLSSLFWFESAFILHTASHDFKARHPLQSLSIPTPRYEKWLHKVISTTQVSQAVVILALLFIFRLKMLNPTVKGKSGSEERLMTCALMLGNKYLDDNTYTNKTWADVSGYSVEEIHIMEIEFLSNMKFNLYTSKEQWKEWQQKVDQFLVFYDAAANGQFAMKTSPEGQNTYLHPQLPPHQDNGMLPSLPSPPLSETQYSTPASPVSADLGYAAAEPRQPMRLPHEAPNNSANTAQNGRKRAREEYVPYEPRTKRVATEGPYQSGVRSHPYAAPVSRPPPLQLEPPVGAYHYGYTQSQPFYLPPLPILPSNAPPTNISFYSENLRPPQFMGVSTAPTTHNINIPSLPPNFRPAADWNTPASSSSYMPSLAVTAAPTLPSSTCSSRQSSPYGYNRSSPYRPVREVNTLLIPPPSTPLQLMPTSRQSISYNTLTASRGHTQTGTLPYLPQDYTWPVPF